VTTLDPHFKIAYRFGAIFLAEPYPAGPGRPDLAIRLLERGIEQDSARWEYMEDIGLVHYWSRRDYQAAAEWFRRAGEQSGAPTWLAPLAATTLAQGGDRSSSRALWTELGRSADLDWLRNMAAMRLQQLDAMDLVDELNRRMTAFKEREHRLPRDLREFAAAEGIKSVPVDPTGVPLVFDASRQEFTVDRRSSLYPLPTGPGTAPRATP
jgi:hypothetical protein